MLTFFVVIALMLLSCVLFEYLDRSSNTDKKPKVQVDINNIGGEVVKDNETYILKDNKLLKNLVLSSTLLKPKMSTRGHKHAGQEEVYYFVEGTGQIELDGVFHNVKPGDVFLIEDGVFHRVHNNTDKSLYFVCVFDGKRNH